MAVEAEDTVEDMMIAVDTEDAEAVDTEEVVVS